MPQIQYQGHQNAGYYNHIHPNTPTAKLVPSRGDHAWPWRASLLSSRIELFPGRTKEFFAVGGGGWFDWGGLLAPRCSTTNI
jgi:hypothetical protein